MPRTITAEGRTITVPDDATDEEINQIFGPPPTTTTPASQHPALDAMKDFGKGVLKSGLSTLSAGDEFAQKHLPAFLTTPIGQSPTAENSARAVATAKQMATPTGTAQAIGKGLGNAAQFLIPGAAEEAGASMLAPTIGKLAARMTTGALGSGVVNVSQGGGFGAGAAAGAAGPVIGKVLKSVAPVIAEQALGVRGVDRALGKTPGDAILNETTGLTPGTIASQANDVSNGLTSAVERRMTSAPEGSLTPARNAATSFQKTAVARNSPESIKRTGALVNQLTQKLGADGKPLMEPTLGQVVKPTGILDSSGSPITREVTQQVGQQPVTYPETVPARTLLDLKRGVGELQGSWNPAIPNKLSDTAVSNVYHALDSEMDGLAPGTKELNQRISSLIPVANRAGAADLNEGLIGRTIGRFGKPTGALVGGLAGAAEGRREGGTNGAIIGGLTGLVAPEILSNPTTLMTGARMMYSPATRKLIPAIAGLGLQLDHK